MVLLLQTAGPADRLTAQKILEQFSSENLVASAVGIDVGVLAGADIRGTRTAGLRVDFGRVAPSIRVLVGASYFQADLSARRVKLFFKPFLAILERPKLQGHGRQVGVVCYVALK